MTSTQIFIYYGMPFVVAGFGTLLYYFGTRSLKKAARSFDEAE